MSIPLPILASTRIHKNATASASPFSAPDGVANVFSLVDRYGFPIKANANVTAMHRTDWQGRQLLYPTARTNSIHPSEPTLATVASIAGTPSPINTTIVTSGPTFSGIAFPANPTVSQQVFLPTTIDPTTIGIGDPVYVSALVHAASGVAPDPYLDFRWVVGGRQLMIDSQIATPCGTNCWYVSAVGHITNTASGVNIGLFRSSALSHTSSAISFSAISCSLNAADVGVYIPTTTAASTVTDYTYDSAGVVTLGQVPLATATLDWDGTGLSVG